MIIKEISHVVSPGTYDAQMARSQCYRIAKHAMKIYPLLRDDQDVEAWIGKKINLASAYVEAVYDYQMTDKKGLNDDVGEGHMHRSELYQIAKESIELLEMIQPGDKIEGWVQKYINLASDYLIAVYHYLDYQKQNPYREELEPEKLTHHSSVIQKNLDEILKKKTRTNDIDTKPGMMRILKKRVHEVEKEHAKENRKTNEAALDEGLKDWLQRIAAAGIIVGSVAGIGSINSAMDNSIPAIQAMNKALDVANQKGDKQTAQMIKHDIDVAKISLDSGKDLNTVRQLQDKYVKFMPADYKPSTPAVKFKESFKDRIMKKITQPIKDYNKEKEQEPKKYESKLAEKLANSLK